MTNDNHKVRVWDLPTRLFHWLLAALVVVGLVTGFLSPEWWMDIHVWAGYGIVVLVVFRLIWGVFGPQYSRFSSFAFAPREVFEHLRGVLMRRPAHYLGHNPAGAMMIFALMAVLVAITVSGLLVLGGEENQGPLAGVVRFPLGDAAKDVHEFLVYALMAMVVVHVAGVAVESKMGGENLVATMINGDKKLPAGTPPAALRRARPMAAAISLGLFTLIAGSLLAAAAQMPPTGHQSLPAHSDYQSECSDCHQLYHPSLLPAKSWRGMMNNLEDHFGEDASLDDATGRDIAAYLTVYAGESWDTEAANRFLAVSPDDPWRISATPYWLRKHDEIAKESFALKGFGGKHNCDKCHQDAPGGAFDDQEIRIPKE